MLVWYWLCVSCFLEKTHTHKLWRDPCEEHTHTLKVHTCSAETHTPCEDADTLWTHTLKSNTSDTHTHLKIHVLTTHILLPSVRSHLTHIHILHTFRFIYQMFLSKETHVSLATYQCCCDPGLECVGNSRLEGLELKHSHRDTSSWSKGPAAKHALRHVSVGGACYEDIFSKSCPPQAYP